MSEDLSFNKIIERLQQIHTEFPDLRFGEVVQNSIDKSKRLSNVNINDRSSKSLLTALEEYHTYQTKMREKKNVNKE